MALWSRIVNLFRSTSLDRDIDEELQSHMHEARAEGRDPGEIQRAFGSLLRTRETTHDTLSFVWLELLAADIRFGWRQIRKHPVTSAAAVLSLALGIGACVSAFRLVDSVLFRPLPVAHPEQLHVMGVARMNELGQQTIGYFNTYEMFALLRENVRDRAELMAINAPSKIDLTYSSDDQFERASRQYVSGNIFRSFALQPVLGRLFTDQDDAAPGASPYVVLAYHYWAQRFGKDPSIIGRQVRVEDNFLRIVGIGPEGFTGTEPGRMADIFVPIMMNTRYVGNPDANWFRIWVRLQPHTDVEAVRQRLRATLLAYRSERAKSLASSMPRQRLEQYLNAEVTLDPAAAGISSLQQSQRVPLLVLAVVAGLVLLIACVNVANLMSAQAASRSREMALRVSIGAAHGRLFRLILIESSLLALLASAGGLAFAWWSAPVVAGMINPPSDPIQLVMSFDARVASFAVALTFFVTLLCGLAPALRASAVKPAAALRGGTDWSRNRRLNWLVLAQVSFCSFVCLSSGLFVSSFRRMANQPLGFSPERVLTLQTTADTQRPARDWYSVAESLYGIPGVESAAVSEWALMSGAAMNLDVSAPGQELDGVLSPWFLRVSPGWFETMRIPLLSGRDIRAEEAFPGTAVVNQAFARRFFGGSDPVGRKFNVHLGADRIPVQIVGLTGDARYEGMREAIPAIVYVPILRTGPSQAVQGATLVVRTHSEDPAVLAPGLRDAIPKGSPGFRVSTIRTQEELVRQHTLRERLLATLSSFFAAIALILVGVGFYGILHFSVIQKRREFGIRLALGATGKNVVSQLVLGTFVMATLGSIAGIGAGIAAQRYVEPLLYGVKATDSLMILLPFSFMLLATGIAALAPAIRAIRTDPARLLRTQ